jgi:hypothetical protein
MQETSGDAGSAATLFLSLARSRDNGTIKNTEASFFFFFFFFAVDL